MRPRTMKTNALEKEFGKIFFAAEETFGGIAVFLHSGIADFLKLIDSTYAKPPVEKFPINLGMFMSGIGKFDNKTRVHLVWVNSKMCPTPISAVAPFVHEISHMVDAILERTGVKDSAGETRAYLTEKYTMFVMDKLGLTDASDSPQGRLQPLVDGIAEEVAKKPDEDYKQVRSTAEGKQNKRKRG